MLNAPVGDARTQRLFFALWPPAMLAARIAALRSAFCGGLPGRHVSADDLHLTLVFLGQVDPAHLPALVAAARGVCFRPFSINLQRTDHWPHARTVWLGPVDCPPELLSLVQALGQALQRLGFSPATQPYVPHVSLVRRTDQAAARAWPEALDWPVDTFVLARSVRHEPPGAGPSSYRLLQYFHAGA